MDLAGAGLNKKKNKWRCFGLILEKQLLKESNRQEREIMRNNTRTSLNSLFYVGKIGSAESWKFQS